MSSDTAAAARQLLEADVGDSGQRPPPEIRVDDEDGGAAKLAPPEAGEDGSWAGGERRRSMPANHGRFVDEPYVFSLSQALALSGRRRSEPLTDANAQAREITGGGNGGGGSPTSPHRHVFVDQQASSGKRSSADTVDTERHSPVGATTTTTLLPSLDELSRLQLVARAPHDSPDSDEEPTVAARSRFLSLPQTSDYLTVPARRHSVALIQPTSPRLLDVIAEETVATDSKSLASSRRYSLSCQLNT